MKLIIFLIMSFSLNLCLASSDDGHDEHHEHGHGQGEKVGPNKAVIEFSEDEGMKLSTNTLESFPIKTQMIKQVSKGKYLVPHSSINISLNTYSVFRFRNGHYKQVTIEIIQERGDQYLIKAQDLGTNDEIATSNVSILNITHVFLKDNSEYGHGH